MEFIEKLTPSIWIIIIFVLILLILTILNFIENDKKVANLDCNCSNFTPQHNEQLTVNTPTSTTPNLSLYYTNWCGHSRAFLPEWQKIKTNLDKKITCNEYNCTDEKTTCDQNNIRGFPALILHKVDGTAINYPDTSPRTLNDIVEFVNKNM